ncbi:MAG: sporulation protein YabP [Oscillospiraceae bacterium]|nr:sporulation protein YabP [Oscillospiraceae bacterium]
MNDINGKYDSKSHGIVVENRKKIILTGVKEVESFNDDDIIVVTNLGGLRIRGKKLEVAKINVETGDMEVSGMIDSIHYSDSVRTPNNIITKLFR